MRILIVEDDAAIADVLRRGLVEQHYSVDLAHTGPSGLDLALSSEYDLVILDVMLPGIDGHELCSRLRREGFMSPVLMLTALDAAEDVIRGLDRGADDYLAKPFDFGVLLARVRSLTRRSSGERTSRIELGDFVLDTASRRASRGGRELDLTAKEFALLEYFVMNRGRVLSRDAIAEHVWDINFDPRSNVIESLIRFLRQKIDHSSGPSMIRTLRGAGYRFEGPAETEVDASGERGS